MPKITSKTIPMGTWGNKFQSSEKVYNSSSVSFISPISLSVSYELQNLFSTFGVVRNDFFSEDIKNSRTEVCNTL